MTKLAFRNILSKPLRSIATILAIAVVVAMTFCMISFKGAVYDYIYATETSAVGSADIVISTDSSSDRITKAEPLKNLQEAKDVVATLKLYATCGDEYVMVRGFEANQIEMLQTISIASGEIASLKEGRNDDNVVISEACAKHFGLKVGDMFKLSLGQRQTTCYVGAIAKQEGYFLSDAPYQIIGTSGNFSKLITSSVTVNLCNEIYLTVKEGADIESVILKIRAMDEYKDLLVKEAKDAAYVNEQTQSLTAPVVLAGGAVFLLGIAIIVILFVMSEGEKVSLIAKLKIVGATKRQLVGIFLIESVILSMLGTLIGSALAVGMFVAILKFTLTSATVFNISVLYLFASGIVGFFTAILASLAPVLRAFKGTIRDNQLDIKPTSKWQFALPICLVLLTVVSVIIEFTVGSATGAMGIVSLVLAMFALASSASPLMKACAKACGKSSAPSMKVASLDMTREKRFMRSSTLLTTGMTIAMTLFMAWSVTTSVFTTYVNQFKDMAFVTNVRESVDVDKFKQTDGVKNATKMVWGQGEILVRGKEKTMNILGSEDILDMVDFEFITPKDVVYSRISEDKPYVFVDIALQKLYGIKEGDVLETTIGKASGQVIVGGVLKHELFSGNYLVVSSKTMDNVFGKKVDTVLVVSDGNVQKCVDALRSEYAVNNYYVISALDAYKWDMESMNAVFDLIGTLAVVVALFIFAVTVATALIGRGASKQSRVAMLNAGMSKNALLKTEILEHAIIALVAFCASFAMSVLLASCLIHALRLFGMYFEFMYQAWVVAVVGIAMGAGYALIPLVLGFKKGYTVKKG